MNNYYQQIEDLLQDLLIPARMEHIIEKKSFDKLLIILKDLEKEYQGKDNISRDIAGLLFFIYRTLSENIVTNDYTDESFIAMAKLEDTLDKIFWDSKFLG